MALETFDLTPPLTMSALKARYKELVKRHHPDAHGGDKAAEERLKDNQPSLCDAESQLLSVLRSQ